MKKNRMMRLASILLVCVLLTTSVISGTFAKYTTTVTSDDKARVAYWGFQSSNSMNITGLFADAYGNTVNSVGDNGDDVIAPGTDGKTTFQFKWDEDTTAWNNAKVNVTGPEVSYEFKVEVEDTIDDLINNNENIQWALVKGNVDVKDIVDTQEWKRWSDLVAEIKALSGDADGVHEYGPNTLPTAFTAKDDTYTIAWKWLITGDKKDYNVDGKTLNQDEYDTYMGNAQLLDDCSIKITITATQVD